MKIEGRFYFRVAAVAFVFGRALRFFRPWKSRFNIVMMKPVRAVRDMSQLVGQQECFFFALFGFIGIQKNFRDALGLALIKSIKLCL